MKLLAVLSTVLATTHVAVAATPTQTPKLKKGKKDKTSNNVRAQKQQTQSMVPLPAESRIVGGTFAQPGAYPFFVQGDGCGGRLIADAMGGSKHNVVGDQASAAAVTLNKKGISSSRSVCATDNARLGRQMHHTLRLCAGHLCLFVFLVLLVLLVLLCFYM